ncbi:MULTISPECIES: transposase [Chryseobacterium]|jgi:hypothetical protein|uniref:Helix-turn-helix domain-containing protein n=1 Tax=Chryseobacterium gambrini TaxID=373672 RepID=A0A1N7L8Z3_9FLAO|nr:MULTISPECIES: transposase [Chryseobacterium]PTT75274.1 transposase [Chryseobacterium sp. HMWF001]PVV56635.1 transposase [Chryseobacterium sp. HMWF035]WBV50749.1 helix-turn-helix domain-containing protein [Chryseobacterium gambrini]SIS70309.1 hypothetical protein SAMN05421785_10267 [Chryseobacterium gambrini]
MKHFRKPNYKQIYNDLLMEKYPQKKQLCESLLLKDELSFMDVIKLNNLIFGNNNNSVNQKFRSYNKESIMEILEYQKKNNLNNHQLASHFKMSKNTVSKWKKLHESVGIR